MKINSDAPQNNKPNNPKDNSKLLAIILSVVALVSVGSFFIYNLNHKNDSSPKTEQKSSSSKSSKKSSSKKVASVSSSSSSIQDSSSSSSTQESSSSSESSASSEASSSSEQEQQADPTDNINKLFTTYYQYTLPESSPQQRAQEMAQYASEDVVNKLIPGGLSGQATTQYTFKVEYKLTEPIQIKKVENSDNKYTVSCKYDVTVEDNTSHHSDSYIVTTDGDKISNVSQQSAVTN